MKNRSRILLTEYRLPLSFDFFDSEGFSVTPKANDTLLLSPNIGFFVVDDYPSKTIEFSSWLLSKVRSVYPGLLDDVLYDYRVYRDSAKKKKILIYLLKKEIYTKLEPLVSNKITCSPFFFMDYFSGSQRTKPTADFCFFTKNWQLDSTRGIIDKISVDVDAGADELSKFYVNAKKIAKNSFLFEKDKTGETIKPSFLLGIFFLNVLVVFIFLFSDIYSKQVFLDKLVSETEKFQIENIQSLHLATEVETLEQGILAYKNSIPIDHYQFLSDVAFLLKDKYKIKQIRFQKQHFRLELEGAQALVLFETFSKSGYFENLKISQIYPIDGTRKEKFSIEGDYL